jgi:hypothetical protein
MSSACTVEAVTAGCRVCNNTEDNRIVVTQEMMIGLGDRF